MKVLECFDAGSSAGFCSRRFLFPLVSLAVHIWSLRCAAQASASHEPISTSSVRAEAGAVVARGNSEKESFNAGFEVTREWVRWKQAFGLSGVYAGDAIGTTGQRWDLRTQSDYRFHPKGFSFASSRYEEDRFSGFEYQMALSMGLGWRFFDDDKILTSLALAVGYSVRYNTHPPAGFDTRDALSTVNLVYEID